MRKFSENEKKYIVENEGALTIEQLAGKFNCTGKEVYECYDEMFKSGERIKFYKEIHDKYAHSGGRSKMTIDECLRILRELVNISEQGAEAQPESRDTFYEDAKALRMAINMIMGYELDRIHIYEGDVVQFNENHKWCGSLGIVTEVKECGDDTRYMVGLPSPEGGTAYIFVMASEKAIEKIGKAVLVAGGKDE